MVREKASTDAPQGGYPMRTVAALTGVKPVTLRAWERRYGLIRPHRTPSGHRLYSATEIERIRQILALLDRGMSIGQVGAALDAEIPETASGEDRWQGWREQMLDAAQRYDEAGMDAAYEAALGLFPAGRVTRELLVPVIRELGERWARGAGQVAHEHFFSTYLRNKLAVRLHHRPRPVSGPRLMLACLEGERHEIGLLLFALEAVAGGCELVLLGADLPLTELPEASRRAACDAVVLSGTMAVSWSTIEDRFGEAVARSPVAVCVGGGIVEQRAEAITGAGATPLGTDIEHALAQLRRMLS